jgi:membrane protease YdiL (CAAX protease family)
MNNINTFAQGIAKGWIPWGFLTPVLAIAFILFSDFALEPIYERYHLVDTKTGSPLGFEGLVAFLLASFAALAAMVLAWVGLVERRPLATIGLTSGGSLSSFAHGLLIGCAMVIAVVTTIWSQGGEIVGNIMPAFGSPIALGSIAILLFSFVIQASVEEIVFRGWMLSSIASKLGTVAAIAISSATFTLLHFSPSTTLLTVINTVLFALFACGWALRDGHIWGVMGWHAGWNWLMGTGFDLPITGIQTHVPALLVQLTPKGADYLTGGPEGPEGSAVTTIVLVVGTLLTLLPKQR